MGKFLICSPYILFKYVILYLKIMILLSSILMNNNCNDDEISIDTCLPFIKGMKLIIEDRLISPIKELIIGALTLLKYITSYYID